MQRKTTEDYIGTCQACFGEFKVGDDGLMVLHGYKRPGDGYGVVGNCVGYNHKPFEHEHTLTDKIIVTLHEYIARDQAYLVRLQAGEVTELQRLEEQYDSNHRSTGKKLIHYAPGDKGWTAVLKGAIYRAEADIRWNQGLVAHFQDRVDHWAPGQVVGLDVPCTGRERGLAKAYDPIEAASAVQRAIEKAARDAKPGKLSIMFYQPAVARDPEGYKDRDAEWRQWIDAKDAAKKAFTDAVKQWIKANVEGKTLVREGSGWDLPRDVRDGNRDFDIVIAHIPWENRDSVTEWFSTAQLHENAKKKISYSLAGPPRAH